MEEIRVLHLISTLVSGGVQSVLLNYGEPLQKNGVVFDYLVQGDGDPEVEERVKRSGGRIFQIPALTGDPVAVFRRLYGFCKAHPEYTIFHAHQNYLNGLPLLAARMAGVPVRISHSHSDRAAGSAVIALIRTVLRRMIVWNATDLWACSEPAYRWLYGKAEKGRFILHNAIRAERFAFDGAVRVQTREALGVADKLVCLCVGTLHAIKNQSFLLDVFTQFEKEEPFHLLLVGDGADREALLQKIGACGLAGRVTLLGDRKDVARILCAADCFLLPSRSEGLPVSVIEAQCNGLPCLVSYGVPHEAALSDAVTFAGTEERDAPLWAQTIRAIREGAAPRKGMDPERVRSSGYDLAREGARLAAKYKELAAR